MKTAFVLSGGGALGAIQVGMLRALHNENIVADKMFGTSAGALNCFARSRGGQVGLESLWQQIDERGDVFNSNFGPWLVKKGLYKARPLEKKLRSLPQNSKLPFEVCVQNLNTGLKEYFSDEHPRILEMTVASASIPAVVSPTIVNNVAYVDGGVAENVPLRRAIEWGAERVFVLLCSPIRATLDSTWRAGNMFSVLMRSLQAARLEMFFDDIMRCLKVNQKILAGDENEKRLVEVTVIAPIDPVGDAMDFDRKLVRLRKEYGYQRAKEVLNLPALLKPNDLTYALTEAALGAF